MRHEHPDTGSLTTSRLNQNIFSPMHFVITLSKVKDKRILKSIMEKCQITYKGALIRLTADFSVETLQAQRK